MSQNKNNNSNKNPSSNKNLPDDLDLTDRKPGDMAMPFGKHKNQTLDWIANNDPLYLDWATDLETNNHELKSAILAVAKQYEHEIEDAIENQKRYRYD